MVKNKLESIYKLKIQQFVYEFSTWSKNQYMDQEGNLIHAGEFGMMREEIVKKIIATVLPERYGIGTGFIITPCNQVSTQCDLIVYDKFSAPTLCINDSYRFYPIDCVVAVIEVKSNISKSELKQALIKLKKIKKLRMSLNGRPKKGCEGLQTNLDSEDRLPTFLICNKFTFEMPLNKFSDFYENNKDEMFLMHNMILSVEEGVYLYSDKTQCTTAESIYGHNIVNKNAFISKDDDNYHITIFLNKLALLVRNITKVEFEIEKYSATKDYKIDIQD